MSSTTSAPATSSRRTVKSFFSKQRNSFTSSSASSKDSSNSEKSNTNTSNNSHEPVEEEGDTESPGKLRFKKGSSGRRFPSGKFSTTYTSSPSPSLSAAYHVDSNDSVRVSSHGYATGSSRESNLPSLPPFSPPSQSNIPFISIEEDTLTPVCLSEVDASLLSLDGLKIQNGFRNRNGESGNVSRNRNGDDIGHGNGHEIVDKEGDSNRSGGGAHEMKEVELRRVHILMNESREFPLLPGGTSGIDFCNDSMVISDKSKSVSSETVLPNCDVTPIRNAFSEEFPFRPVPAKNGNLISTLSRGERDREESSLSRRGPREGEWEERGGLIAALWDPEPIEGREVLFEREREALVVAEREAELRRERVELVMGEKMCVPPHHPLAERLGDLQIERLVRELSSKENAIRKNATHQLRMLAKYSGENRGLIAAVGGVQPLANMLRDSDESIVAEAVTALLNMSIHDENKRNMHFVIEPLVEVLDNGSWSSKENAAATLFSLSVVDEHKIKIGAAGAIPSLVEILKKGSEQGKRDACKALFNLSIVSTNKWRLVEAGVMEPLVAELEEPASSMAEKAVSVLANLSTIAEGRQALAETEEGIAGLVEIVGFGSQRGQENAAAALWLLAKNNSKHRRQILQEVVIPPLVTLSQTGTKRAKEKAMLLLRNFRDKNAS